MTDITRIMDLNIQTVYRIVHKFLKDGVITNHSSEKGGPHNKKLTAEQLEIIKSWVDEDCSTSLKKTSEKCAREFVVNVCISLLTYLLIRRYNRFAVLACLRSVRNRSRSRAFVYQSVIPALKADASTPSCHLNLGLPRLLCPCGRPKKILRAGSSVSMRITWPAHRSLR